MKKLFQNISLNSLVPDDKYFSFIVFKNEKFIPIQKTIGVSIFEDKAKFLFEIFSTDIHKEIHKQLEEVSFVIADIFIPKKEDEWDEEDLDIIIPSKIKKSKIKPCNDFLYYISAESDLKNIKIEDNFIDIVMCDKIIKKMNKEKTKINLDLDE
ncbi:MAG: hypothetical protein WC942_10825 [Clostridia bacterium]|jgi:hypothetical protein